MPDAGGATIGSLVEGRYRLDARLGHGATGVVYRAQDMALDRTVALELLVGADAEVVDRFQKEARALAQVRHDNVVQVYTLGRDGSVHYIAMEFVAGRDLGSILEGLARDGTTLGTDRAISIVRRVAEGLTAVHAEHLVHRDVKPGNVVLEARSERPVLVDFGLARRARPSRPELCGASVRSDIHALACTAFELLTGRTVFDAADTAETLLAHGATPPPRISSCDPALAPFDPVFARALAKDARDRYATCAAFLAAFDEAAGAVAGRRAPLAPRITRSFATAQTMSFAAGGFES